MSNQKEAELRAEVVREQAAVLEYVAHLRATACERDLLLSRAIAAEGQVAAVRALADLWHTATELGTGRPSIVMRAIAEELRVALDAPSGDAS